MRVKISYGADITEVPEEVEQLYVHVSAKIRSIVAQSDFIEDALAEEDFETVLPLMDRMRKTLASIDQRLGDISMIAEGYLSYTKQGEEDVSDRRPPVVTAGNDNAQHEPE